MGTEEELLKKAEDLLEALCSDEQPDFRLLYEARELTNELRRRRLLKDPELIREAKKHMEELNRRVK